MNASRLNRGTGGGRAESWAVHIVHGRARVHGDEDGVGQVGENDGEASRQPVRRARANDSKASRLGGRSNTHRHRRFDLKTEESVTSCDGVREDLIGLASKSGADLARSRSERRARDAIPKLASRQSEAVKVSCPSVARTKRWTNLPLRGRVL